MKHPRGLPALLLAAAVLTGCGQAQGGPASSTPDPPLFPGTHAGRLALFGAGPEDATSGVLVLDVATGERVRVGGQQKAWSAAWAGPDHIAVVTGPPRIRGDGGPGRLVLAGADGSDEENAIGDITDVLEVPSSAGGQHLAFLGRTAPSARAYLDLAPAAPLGLYLAAGDGSQVRRVADVPAVAGSLTLSPDGGTVAMLDEGDDTTIPAGRDWCAPGDRRLVLVDAATGDARAVAGMPEIIERPRFSPDGATIVLAGGDFATSPARDLVFVDVATAPVRRLATPDVTENAPVFSPDGRQSAVLRPTTGAGGPGSAGSIAVDRPDGTAMTTVAMTGTEDEDLVWTPDGSALVVAGVRVTPACGDESAPADDDATGGCDVATATSDVRVVDVDGGELRQVSETVSAEAGLAFAP